MSAPIFLVMLFFLPETSADNILLRRARRLRKLTQNPNIYSESEIRRHHLSFGEIVTDSLIKPMEITIKDPAILFTNVYTAVIYGIFYSFFEAFPIVYNRTYGFNDEQTATVFVCIIVACTIAVVIYLAYLSLCVAPDMKKNGPGPQERCLIPGLISTFFTTIGLFLFGTSISVTGRWFCILDMFETEFGSRANNNSLVIQKVHKLARECHRNRLLLRLRLHHQPVHLSIHTHVVSKVCGVTFCS